MRYAFVLALSCILGGYAVGQNSTSTTPGPATATCNFSDQQQLAVQYQQVTLDKKQDKNFLGHDVPYGKVWEPGKQPLTLFTNSPVTIDGKSVPVGAYTVYLIPNQKEWTLVVSKNTNRTAGYDASKDLVRAAMQIGQLPAPEPQFSVYFAHTGPKECTMRIDIADTRAWVPFEQK